MIQHFATNRFHHARIAHVIDHWSGGWLRFAVGIAINLAGALVLLIEAMRFSGAWA